MNTTNTDRIEKQITLNAPRSRVWRALTDATEFGRWFGVRLEGEFAVGEKIRGPVTTPGYEHLVLEAWVERIEPEHTFAFRWHPHAQDPERDYTGEPTTLVEFVLEDEGSGTRLTLTESGFDALPDGVRRESFLRNEGGWVLQMDNIREHVDG
ncbi:MAG: SRPBCC family protein [Planctomycetota bacterium]